MYPNLDVEMAKLRITRQKLAKLIGITPTTLSLKLNGKSKISLAECIEIKKALGSEQSIEELFFIETDRRQKMSK